MFRIFKITLIFLCILFWVIVSIAHNSSYYFSKSSKFSDIVVNIFPQGWGFFTKDPRNEYNYNLYSLSPDRQIDSQITHSNSTFSSSYGFSKNNRRCFYEIGLLTAEIKESDWSNYKGTEVPMPQDSSFITLNSEGLDFSCILKNTDYLLLRSKTVPFAWSGKNQEDNRPGQAIHLKIN